MSKNEKSNLIGVIVFGILILKGGDSAWLTTLWVILFMIFCYWFKKEQ